MKARIFAVLISWLNAYLSQSFIKSDFGWMRGMMTTWSSDQRLGFLLTLWVLAFVGLAVDAARREFFGE